MSQYQCASHETKYSYENPIPTSLDNGMVFMCARIVCEHTGVRHSQIQANVIAQKVY